VVAILCNALAAAWRKHLQLYAESNASIFAFSPHGVACASIQEYHSTRTPDETSAAEESRVVFLKAPERTCDMVETYTNGVWLVGRSNRATELEIL